MVRIGRILRDYHDAGSVNELLSLWGFVDDSTFLTKAGDVGLVYRLDGVDYEGLAHLQRQALAHRLEAGLRLLDEHCRIYQYLLKRIVARFAAGPPSQPVAHEAIQRRVAFLNSRREHLYDLSLYLVLLYEAPHVLRRSTTLQGLWGAPLQAMRAWLSSNQALRAIESELDRTIGTLHHKAQGFEVQITDFGPERLRKADAFRFFRELLNYNPAVVNAARLTHDTHLDYFVSDSSVDCHRDHLLVGDRIVKVLTTKEPPSQTYAFLLQDLYEIPGEFIACLEWQRIPSDRMRRDVQSRRRHFFNKRVSLVNYVAPETRPDEMLVDDSANTTVRQLGDPTDASHAGVFREFILRNSDVGAAALTLDMFLFRAVCGNPTSSGAFSTSPVSGAATWERRFRRLGPHRSTVSGLPSTRIPRTIASSSCGPRPRNSGRRVTRLLMRLCSDWSCRKSTPAEAYMLAETFETNPRSVWGYVQGLTRLSQRTPWRDGRFTLDRAASRLLTAVH